jgi:hypothetical protein
VTQSVLTAAGALLIAGGLLWLGRNDLTRPAVAFGVPWFGFVALGQLRLTELEQPWSAGFTAVAIGGGLAFVLAAIVAGGTAPARGAMRVDRDGLRERRLVGAAIVLIAAGVVGAAYKAHVLGGIPVLSDDPDVVRARAGAEGRIILPAWSSALTNGFHLGMWCALAALWVGRSSRSAASTAGLWLLAAAGLAGTSFDASRNVILFALVVPAIAAYLVARRRSIIQAASIGAAACVLTLGVGGLFVARVARSDSTALTYVEREIDRHPLALRPLVPIYVNAIYPLEAARRVYDAVPERLPYGLGANSLLALPDALFPEGKPTYSHNVAVLMDTGRKEQLSWAVATYQGRLLADLGWQGVALGSILLGLAFGSLHRWARNRAGLMPIAAIGYVAYYSAYMAYDNLASFTLISVFDLAVIAGLGVYCTGKPDPEVRGS